MMRGQPAAAHFSGVGEPRARRGTLIPAPALAPLHWRERAGRTRQGGCRETVRGVRNVLAGSTPIGQSALRLSATTSAGVVYRWLFRSGIQAVSESGVVP